MPGRRRGRVDNGKLVLCDLGGVRVAKDGRRVALGIVGHKGSAIISHIQAGYAGGAAR